MVGSLVLLPAGSEGKAVLTDEAAVWISFPPLLVAVDFRGGIPGFPLTMIYYFWW